VAGPFLVETATRRPLLRVSDCAAIHQQSTANRSHDGGLENHHRLRIWQVLCLVHTGLLLLFFGFLHQSGVTPSLIYLSHHAFSPPCCIVYHHVYMPPRFLLIPNSSSCHVIDVGSGNEGDLRDALASCSTATTGPGPTMLAIPGTMKLPPWLSHRATLVTSIEGHITTEDMISFPSPSTPLSMWKSLRSQATLPVYSIVQDLQRNDMMSNEEKEIRLLSPKEEL